MGKTRSAVGNTANQPDTTTGKAMGAVKATRRSQNAKTAEAAKAAKDNITGATPKTKAEHIITLLKQPNGASIAELANATGWQPHSVHGFMSGTLKKKLGLRIESKKDGSTDRRYAVMETPR